MNLLYFTLLFPLVAIIKAYVPESTLATDLEAVKSLANLIGAFESGELKKHLRTLSVDQSCSISQLAVRRE
jgi:hypothetical protein